MALECNGTGTCLRCSDGYFGYNCSKKCPANCLNSKCNRVNGACTSKCILNFDGAYCDRCAQGRYGNDCNKSCPLLCRNNVCDKRTGECSYGCRSANVIGAFCDKCVKGKFGTQCSQDCSNNCQSSECNMYYGHCTKGCVGSFAGPNCSFCQSGRYGVDCSQTCSYCFNSLCNDDGVCGACEDGLYGAHCNYSCPDQCMNITKPNATCDIQTGVCIYGCADGFFGMNCSMPRVSLCSYGKCDQETGGCLAGCLSGSTCNEGRSFNPFGCQNILPGFCFKANIMTTKQFTSHKPKSQQTQIQFTFVYTFPLISEQLSTCHKAQLYSPPHHSKLRY